MDYFLPLAFSDLLRYDLAATLKKLKAIWVLTRSGILKEKTPVIQAVE